MYVIILVDKKRFYYCFFINKKKYITYINAWNIKEKKEKSRHPVTSKRLSLIGLELYKRESSYDKFAYNLC